MSSARQVERRRKEHTFNRGSDHTMFGMGVLHKGDENAALSALGVSAYCGIWLRLHALHFLHNVTCVNVQRLV
jgi:hypothetical protein